MSSRRHDGNLHPTAAELAVAYGLSEGNARNWLLELAKIRVERYRAALGRLPSSAERCVAETEQRSETAEQCRAVPSSAEQRSVGNRAVLRTGRKPPRKDPVWKKSAAPDRSGDPLSSRSAPLSVCRCGVFLGNSEDNSAGHFVGASVGESVSNSVGNLDRLVPEEPVVCAFFTSPSRTSRRSPIRCRGRRR
jgi:hypothetical protein